MIENIALPRKFNFLRDKKILKNFFEKLYSKKIKIRKIKLFPIKMGGSLKIFAHYLISLDNGEKKDIHAIHRFGGSMEKEFKILKYLVNFKFQNPYFLSPRPIFFFKKEKFLVYEELLGKPLSLVKKEKILSLLKIIIPCFVFSLYQLHQTRPSVSNYDLKKEFKSAKIFEKEFKRFFPERKLFIENLISNIVSKKKFYLQKIKSPSFIHNDVTFRHIILQKKKIGLIDFSESCFSDPLVDVATFLAQLDYLRYLMPQKEKDIFKIQEKFTASYSKLIKNDFSKEERMKKINAYRSWANLQNAIFSLGPEAKIQNKTACIWFLKLAGKIINGK